MEGVFHLRGERGLDFVRSPPQADGAPGASRWCRGRGEYRRDLIKQIPTLLS